MFKLRKLSLRNPLSKRKKNINNGSGDNNNNSNQGEKAKEIGQLVHLRYLDLGSDADVGAGGQVNLLPASGLNLPERPNQPEDCAYYMRDGTCKFGYNCRFHHPQVNLLPASGLNLPERPDEPDCLFYMRTGTCKFGHHCKFHHPKELTKDFSKLIEDGSDVSGGDKDKKGDGSSSGGDGDGDNDGWDKTEGGGGGGGSGKMEVKGQRDTRNSHSYYAGDENGYPVGQLQRCYYEKPNVCSIIPYQVLV